MEERMLKWEYKRVIRTFSYERKEWQWNDGGKESVDDKLCSLGLSGWELVSETALSMDAGEGWPGRTSDMTYIFKRPVET
jgi:hypothetical protein